MAGCIRITIPRLELDSKLDRSQFEVCEWGNCFSGNANIWNGSNARSSNLEIGQGRKKATRTKVREYDWRYAKLKPWNDRVDIEIPPQDDSEAGDIRSSPKSSRIFLPSSSSSFLKFQRDWLVGLALRVKVERISRPSLEWTYFKRYTTGYESSSREGGGVYSKSGGV